MTPAEKDAFMEKWRQTHEFGALPGAMLMTYGPEEYVGATLCIRGVLYFEGAHTTAVREALAACFDLYAKAAKGHLTWLLRDEPPRGPKKFAYPKAPSLRSMMDAMNKNDHVGFAYHGGEKPGDASPWLFFAHGKRAWEARLGWFGLDSLEFSLPKHTIEENPVLFQELFHEFARLLKARHGHGGFAFNLSLFQPDENESTEAFMTTRMAGIDAGTAQFIGAWHEQGIDKHIAKIGWLTAINSAMLQEVGGLDALRSALPADWFANYDYGTGLIIQAGPAPEIADVALDPQPAIYVLPMMALRTVFITDNDDLHGPSHAGEPRLAGAAARQWLRRFEVPEDELMHYRAKLLDAPRLTPGSVLPDAL